MIELMRHRMGKNTIILNSQRKRRAGSGIIGDCLFQAFRERSAICPAFMRASMGAGTFGWWRKILDKDARRLSFLLYPMHSASEDED